MGRCVQTLNRKPCEGQRSSVAGSGSCPSTCVFWEWEERKNRMNAGKTEECLQLRCGVWNWGWRSHVHHFSPSRKCLSCDFEVLVVMPITIGSISGKHRLWPKKKILHQHWTNVKINLIFFTNRIMTVPCCSALVRGRGLSTTAVQPIWSEAERRWWYQVQLR